MLRKVLACSAIVLAAAGTTPAGSLRLRGGGPITWAKLTGSPDVLKEGYDTSSKVTINKASDLNGNTGLKAVFNRASANKITSSLTATTKLQNVDVEASVDETGTIKGTATYPDISPGLKLAVAGELEGGKNAKDIPAPKVSGEYVKDNMCVTAAIEGNSLDVGGVVEAGEVLLGATTTYDSASGKLADPSFAGRYKGDNFALTALLKGLKGDDIQGTYTQSVNSDLDVAGSFETSGNKFSVGAAYKLDGDSAVRGKLNSDGILNVGYSRSTTAGSSLKAGLEVNTNDLDSRKLGVSLTIQ